MIRPWFYDKFVCIADRCTDNCCRGWEIDIDEPAMERFRGVPGEFGERLRSAIREQDGQRSFAAVLPATPLRHCCARTGCVS